MFSQRDPFRAASLGRHERLLRKWAVLLQLGQETTIRVLPRLRHERRSCHANQVVPSGLPLQPSMAGRVPLPPGRAGAFGPDSGAAAVLAGPAAPDLSSPGFPGRQRTGAFCAAWPGRLRWPGWPGWPCCPGWPSSWRACAGRADLHQFRPTGAGAATSGVEPDGRQHQRTDRPPC